MKALIKKSLFLVLFILTVSFIGCDNSNSDNTQLPETGIRFHYDDANSYLYGVRYGNAIAEPLTPGYTAYTGMTPGTYDLEIKDNFGNWLILESALTIIQDDLITLKLWWVGDVLHCQGLSDRSINKSNNDSVLFESEISDKNIINKIIHFN